MIWKFIVLVFLFYDVLFFCCWFIFLGMYIILMLRFFSWWCSWVMMVLCWVLFFIGLKFNLLLFYILWKSFCFFVGVGGCSFLVFISWWILMMFCLVCRCLCLMDERKLKLWLIFLGVCSLWIGMYFCGLWMLL